MAGMLSRAVLLRFLHPFARAGAVLLHAAAFALAGWVAPAAAGSEGFLTVSARVLPYARVELHSAPASVSVTQEDIRRGFVDADAPLSFSMTSNRGQGALLTFTPVGGFFEQAAVSGLPQAVVVDRAGLVVALPSTGGGREHRAVTLRFRFFLATSTLPGVHAWPLKVSTEVL